VRRALLLVLIVSGLGCRSVSSERSPQLDVRAPLRVAVLPFVDAAEGDRLLAVPLGALMDVVPLLSDDAQDKAHCARILRHKVHANLHRTQLEPLSPLVIDHQLAAAGLDPAQLHAGDRAASARAVARALGVDLVVFGTVLEWDRDYVLVASWLSTALDLELRDGRSGELVYRGEVSDVKTAGLHKGLVATEPAEFAVILVGEPLRGLRNTLFEDLSNEITRLAVDDLLRTSGAAGPEITHVAARVDGGRLTALVLGAPGAPTRLELPGLEPVLLRETAPGTCCATVELPPGWFAESGHVLQVGEDHRELRAALSIPQESLLR